MQSAQKIALTNQRYTTVEQLTVKSRRKLYTDDFTRTV